MTRDPAEVPLTVVHDPSTIPDLHDALAGAVRVAIDTETPIGGPCRGQLRVMSVAVRDGDGSERVFVVDARDVEPRLLQAALTGVVADAWNANFDARVIDAAVWGSADTTTGLRWWDVQLADALLHQGMSGVTWYHGLAWATAHYLGIEAEGKGTVQVSFTASDDLSPDQIRYAAADAIETLWVGDAVRAEITRAGLDEVAGIEMDARPFLDRMERSGLPFDWSGWEAELGAIADRLRAVTGRLAELTGGGQGTLFDDVTEPSWNPSSDRQVKDALNRWATDAVRAWTSNRGGDARLLHDGDSVNAAVLAEIGGPLCDALLEFRAHTKILTTYGDSIRQHLDDDGRMRPQYLQVVGTNTGRLASRNPNAQNFAPRMLPHVRPAEPGRVFVHADLSQAELRVLAQVAGDEALRDAFARGDDIHLRTAATMFGVDAASLRTDDPDRFARLRRIAKALNFGIAYGTGAAALGRSLTAEGTPTTIEEAASLLAQYRRTYPGTAAWAEARIAEIHALRESAASIDWRATMRLARGHADVTAIRRDMRRADGRWPTIDEIAGRHPDRHELDARALAERIEWLSTYHAPVALGADGRPLTFASRTIAGRRQQFNLHLDRLFLAAVVEAVRADDPTFVRVRDRFEVDHGLTLCNADGTPASAAEVERQFEERALRRSYVEAVAAAAGKDAADALLTRAAQERIGAMVNAWRNAPIQGTVADIMLVAYADLDARLRRYRSARPVQTVHDSIVVECDVEDAPAIAADLRISMERASLRFCPDVVPRADVDIRTDLSDASAVAFDETGISPREPPRR